VANRERLFAILRARHHLHHTRAASARSEGVNYHFVSHEEFERMIREDELIEYAQVHGNFYGVPQKSVLDRINNGDDVVCVIDVQGALRIRGLFPAAVLVSSNRPRDAKIRFSKSGFKVEAPSSRRNWRHASKQHRGSFRKCSFTIIRSKTTIYNARLTNSAM
jgi:guanylate kinase